MRGLSWLLKTSHIILFLIFIPSLLFGDTKLAILGSGTPNPDPDRMGSGYAVITDQAVYLIDFGPGIIRNAAQLSQNWGGKIPQMNVANFEHAFLTHLHSDHTMGIADLLLTPWVMGRSEPINLYGPKGLDQLAANTLKANKIDIDYRINGTQPANKTGYKFIFKELDEGIVFENEEIKVEAFKVPHGDFEDAYGFRFTTADKVIVFSGDTGKSLKIAELAKNADILVHEVYSLEGFKKKTKDWQKYHSEHHTSTIEVGEIASLAKPKKLVLSHILFWGSTPKDIMEEVRSTFTGNIIIAEDGMIIE
mgnify:FL=1